MYENTTYDVILRRMLARVPDDLDKRESSLIWDTHSATAIELQVLYIELDTMIKNMYGDTAAREFLILLCSERGITPDPATHAILKGTFTPADIDVTGKRFNIGDLNYVVTEMIVPGEYQVKCETAGSIGNRYMGNMTPMEYLYGLRTAVLSGVLIPGKDEEDTEALRRRYFDSFKQKASGGNRADYLAAVRSIEGVGDVKVTRVWNAGIRPQDLLPGSAVADWYASVKGELSEPVAAWLSAVYAAASEKKLTTGGTVLLTVVNALDFGEADDILLDHIQNIMDPDVNAGEGYGLAPIGHMVKVESAVPVEIFITAHITFDEGYGWAECSAAIRESLERYLLGLRREWAEHSRIIVRVSQIEAGILEVPGVIDIEETKLNGGTGNLTLGPFEIPVTGGVSE